MRRFVDPSRLVAPLLVVGSVLALFGVIDVSLRLALGLAPHELASKELLNPAYRSEIGSRVSAAELELQRSKDERPLTIVLGFSTAREGIVETDLARRDPSRRWFNLAGSGAGFHELSYYTRPLMQSRLHPELIILGVHPVWMAGREATPPSLNTSPGHALALLRKRQLRPLKQVVTRWSWLAFNRTSLNLAARRELAAARDEIFVGMELPLTALFQPSADPWLVKRRYDGHATDKVVTGQWRSWESFRWFDSARYREGVEREYLARVLADCRAIAKRVVIVWLPESAQLRKRVPPEAAATFLEVVRGSPEPPAVVDLREALPEELFYDLVHPNREGRTRLTELLGERLDELRSR